MDYWLIVGSEINLNSNMVSQNFYNDINVNVKYDLIYKLCGKMILSELCRIGSSVASYFNIPCHLNTVYVRLFYV